MNQKLVSIFVVENKELKINVPELVLLREFKALLKNKVEIEDNTKLYRVLKFMWFFGSYDSPHIFLPDQQRFEESIHDAGLPDDYYPSSIEMTAAEKFADMEENRFPEMKLLVALKRGFEVSQDTVEMLTQEIIDYNAEIKKSKDELHHATAPEDRAVYQAQVNASKENLKETQNMLQGLQTKIPKAIHEIEDMTERVKKKISEKYQIKGGGALGNRENPMENDDAN